MQKPVNQMGGRQVMPWQKHSGHDQAGKGGPQAFSHKAISCSPGHAQAVAGQTSAVKAISGQTRRSFLRAALAGLVFTAVPSLLTLPSDAIATVGKDQGQPNKAWPLRRQTQLFMGTMVSITVAGASASLADEAIGKAFELGRKLEAIYSRFDSSSPVSLLNSQGRLADAPPALLQLLAGAENISRATAGLFDVTVLPLLKLGLPKQPETSKPGMAGMPESGRHNLANGGIEAFIPDLSADLSSGFSPDLTSVNAAHDLKAASELVGYQNLVCKGRTVNLARSGMGITLDGIAKGHVANAMSALLASLGCPNHLVNAGGDIVSAGQKGPGQPWRVGVADPLAPSRHLTTLDLPERAAVATSGIGLTSPKAAHIVRPDGADSAKAQANGGKQGKTTFDLASQPASATVMAPDGLTADAMATALCLLPARDCLNMIETMPGCACCLVNRDGGIVRSGRWPGGGEMIG